MILAGHQPNYLPYLGFFHKAARVDVFAIVDNVQFVKRGPFGFQNRARIRTGQGRMWLTVPVLTKGKFHQEIREVRIDNNKDWRHKHWRSLVMNYERAPHFHRYRDFFEEVYMREWEYLGVVNEALIRYLLRELGIGVRIVKTSELGCSGKGTEFILDMCRKTGAGTYLHGKHGRDYVDQALLEAGGVKSVYQEFDHPVHPQQWEPFLPLMSAVDLLFNCGPSSLEVLMGGCASEGVRP